MSVPFMFWVNGFCMLLMGSPVIAIAMFVVSAGWWIADRIVEVRRERKACEQEAMRWAQMREEARKREKANRN